MHYKNFVLLFIFILISNLTVTAQDNPGTQNLTHLWTFENGTAADMVGGADGILKGGAKILNGSLQTASPDSWLELPAGKIALNKYNELTLEVWFKSVPNGNPGYHMIASFGDTKNSIGVNYFFITPARGDNKSRAAISCGDETTPWASETGADGPELDDGQIHQMVSTIDSANITLYIDGQLQASTPLDTNNNIARISSNYAYLAKSVYDGDSTWKGSILQCSIYDKALTPAEVLYLYKNENVNAGERPVIVEAESGKLGSNFAVKHDAANNITYVTAVNNSTAFVPGDSSHVATYTVTFSDSGYYSLFAHVLVGPNGYNDDSFLYGRDFGVMDDTAGADWILVNGLAGAGFNDSSAIVKGAGTLGSQVWKWVNITQDSTQFPADSFYVSSDSLTRTFQIATREDGLDIDKFAFGKTDLLFTVNDLDKGLPGSGAAVVTPTDTVKLYQGPPLAQGAYKFLGNVKNPNGDNNFANYWNQITPGNEGKWGSVAISQDTTKWNWSGLDTLYNYAQEHHLIFKDHNLIWGQQQPSWISSLDSAQQIKYIETWIRMVGQRYPNIDMIDVVNEPLNGHNPPDGQNGRANYENALGGKGTTGWDWVINAFKLARKYLPNAKLLINDYGIINDNSATTSYLQIINLLKDRGLIDGIGVQGHRFALENADTTTLKNNLNRLGATGLPVYISELDLGNIGNTGTPDDNTQLQLYKKIFPILWTNPAVKGITLWGYKEGEMWQTTCYLINSDNSWRPAMTWLAQYVKDNPLTGVEKTASNIPASYELYQNYPNPFNPSTNIKYSIVRTAKVTLQVYDILGRLVRTLVNNVQSPGQYTVSFDAGNLASGIYFYRINTGNFTATKKLMLIK